jgi:hypothetical protein
MTAAFWRAWSIWAVSVAATATGIVYTSLYPLPKAVVSQGGSPADKVVVLVYIASAATMGALLAWKRPGNPIGWLLSAAGLAYALGALSTLVLHFRGTQGAIDWLGWIWLFGIGLIVFVVLLFPTGALPSRRWRPVAWAAGAGLAGWVLGNAFAPTLFNGSSPNERNPVGLAGAAGTIFKGMVPISVLLIVASGLAAIASVAFRYRRAGTAERAQLKWLVYAGGVIVVCLLAGVPLEKVLGPGASDNIQNAMTSGVVALVPVAIGVAVLRYRLYDIDRIISRTVAYTIVTGLLIGVYAGLVLLATEVLRIHSAVAVAAATLAAAALFNPVRRRVQHRVDRRFNRTRYDADEMVAAFAARLKDAVNLEAIRADLADVVQTALEPAQVWVWTQERQSAEAARTAARIASSSPSNGTLPSMRSPLT